MSNAFLKLDEVLTGYNKDIEIDIERLIKEAKIDVREDLKPPEAALIQVNSENEEDNRILCTRDNIMLISGKAKSRKSFLLGFLIAPLISGKEINGIRGCLPSNKRNGILFDTEQGKYHVQIGLKRICKLSGIEYPNNLDVYALRKYTPSERLTLVEHAIYNTPNLGFVVIDGIKDLITSINDEGEATMIISKLMKWSEELNIAIITVLHQNKSDTNARGHIGTEAINKAETHLSVTKSEAEDDISLVEPQGCRNREPEAFAFEIDGNGLPILAEDFKVRTETKSSRIEFSEIDDFKIFEMLNAIYALDKEYTYSNLVIQVQLHFKDKFKKTIGTNKAKEMITYCKNNKWLIQEGSKQPYNLGQYSND